MGADMRKNLTIMLLIVTLASIAGAVYAAKIKVGTAISFPVDV
jgi:hypothetical protein